MKNILMLTCLFGTVIIILTLYIQNPVFAILPQSNTENLDFKAFVNSSEPLQLSFEKEHQVSIGDQTYSGKRVTIDPNLLRDGEQSITWRAVDEIGPLTLTTPKSQSSTIVIDSTPPATPEINRETLPVITHFQSKAEIDILNLDTELVLLINDTAAETSSVELTSGDNTFRFQFKDRAGNLSKEEVVAIKNIADSNLSQAFCENTVSILYPNDSLQLGYSGYINNEEDLDAESIIADSNQINCTDIQTIRAPESFKQVLTLYPIGTEKFCYECGVFDEQYISLLVGPESYAENQDPFLVNYSNETYKTPSGIEGLIEQGSYNFPGLSPDQLYPPNFSFQSFSFKVNNRTIQIRMERDDFKAFETEAGQKFYRNIERDFDSMIETLIADF